MERNVGGKKKKQKGAAAALVSISIVDSSY